MKKLAVLIILSIPAWGVAHHLGRFIDHATARALTQSTVEVRVKLAKPVYMSEVMFRPVRGRDTVIRIDYKEQTCTGRLSVHKTHVVVPSSCVQDGKYKVTKISLTFANGHQVKKTGQSVQVQDKLANIRL